MRRLNGLVVVALLVGCGHVTTVDNPGEHWLQVQTQNFRVFTDAKPVHYEFVAARLEHLQQAIKQAFFPNLKTPPLDVLFLNDESLFRELTDNVDISAMFVPSVGEEGVLIMKAGEGEEDESTAGLGVASHLVRHAVPRAPPWLHLGFSTFLETAVVKPDGTSYFGRPPLGQAIDILQGRLLPLDQLEKARWADLNGPENRRHYATAWAFVHYMAVGGTPQVHKDLFAMLNQASTGNPNAVLFFPIAQYEEGFRDYALRTFAGKPSVKVLVERLGTLSDPPLQVTPAPVARIKALLQEIKATRNKP